MAYDVSQIIPINTYISAAGISSANFSLATLFAKTSELPVGFTVDTKRTYSSLKALSADFADTTETYKAAQKWFASTPAVYSLVVWATNGTDATITATLNKARNIFWWYWSFFTKDVYADLAKVELISAWADANDSAFMNCQTGTACADIRDENETGDIATVLTSAGYRHTFTATHATDPYAGIALCKHFARVDYSVANSTITGEFKKSPGVTAEDLTDSEYAAMTADTKKAMFYTVTELQGSTDQGRWINTWSHSTYGEWMDDVINLDVFVNALKVALYNVLAKSTTKVPQTPVGQALLIGAARHVCETYISNGYLGPRNYTDPDDGVDKYTVGYEILTKPEDILDLSDSDRTARKAVTLRVRVFRAGAIHEAPVDVTVY